MLYLPKTEEEHQDMLKRIEKILLKGEDCTEEEKNQLEVMMVLVEKYIGTSGRVSEILNRKRNLTLPMIRKLNKHLGIPADILIQKTKSVA